MVLTFHAAGFFHDAFYHVSLISLAIIILVVLLLGAVYFLDLLWNLVRALHHPSLGLRYFFSRHGPEN